MKRSKFPEGGTVQILFLQYFLLGQLASLMPPTHLPSTPVFPSDNQPPLRFTGYSENLCVDFGLNEKLDSFQNIFCGRNSSDLKIYIYIRNIFLISWGGGLSFSPLSFHFPRCSGFSYLGGELNLSGLQTDIADFRSTFILMII